MNRFSTPRPTPARGALLASVLAGALFPAAAYAEADETADADQPIVVTGEREAETSYKVSRSTAGMRTDTPLVDTPQSVSVVTVKQIGDQAANSIGDAIRYTPGVYSAQGEGNRETLVFRGMTTTGDFFVDSIRDDVQTYRDLYNIERLEVFRGPNAMAFGRGGTGGLINRVTKVADFVPTREVRFEAGMFEHFRGSIDLGDSLSERVAARVTGVYQSSESYRDGVTFERLGVNPTLSFRLGESTVIQVGYEHFEDDRIADRGGPSQLRPAGFTGAVDPLATPRGQFFGDPKNSPTFTNTDAGNLYISHDFGGGVSLRNRTRFADYDKFYQNIFTAGLNATALTNPAGLPAGTYAPGSVAQLQAYNNATVRRNLVNQTDFTGKFATGSVGHTLLVGAEFGRQETENLRLEGFFPVPGNPGGVQSIYVPVTAPRVSRADILWRPIASSGDNAGTLDIAAGYIQDQVALTPQLEVVLGLRFEHLVTKVRDRRTVGFPAGQQRDFRAVDDVWSPRAGIIFKPIENASFYASYSRSYLPRGGDQLTGLSLTNQSLDPERYTNYELGAKWDASPGFSVTAAVYQLDRDNVIVLVDPNNPGTGTELGGGQRSRGFELGFAGSITPELSLVGAYTYQEAEFVRAISTTVQNGAKIPNAPRHSASLWGRYDVTPKLGVALGAVYQGERFAAQDNLVRLPGYTRVDAALFYRISDAIRLQVNIENVLNERYFIFAHNNTNITPGGPTSVRGTVSFRF